MMRRGHGPTSWPAAAGNRAITAPPGMTYIYIYMHTDNCAYDVIYIYIYIYDPADHVRSHADKKAEAKAGQQAGEKAGAQA